MKQVIMVFGAIKEVVTEVKARGLKKGLVVTDKDLIKFGVATKVTDLLDEAGLAYEIYDEVKANPTVEQVKNGVQATKDLWCRLFNRYWWWKPTRYL